MILKYKDSYIVPVNFFAHITKFWTDLNMYMDPNLFKTNYISLKKTVVDLMNTILKMYEDIPEQIM